MKISLYGPYPPNIGGVSIHIQRLATKLMELNVLDLVYVNNFSTVIDCNYLKPCVDLSDTRRFNLFKRIKSLLLMKKTESSIYHMHGAIIWDYFYVYCLTVLCRRKVLFTLHDHIQLSRNRLILKIIAFFYRLIPHDKLYFIAVNSRIKDQLVQIGIKSSSIRIIPAFIKENNKSDLDVCLQEELITDSVKILLYAPSLVTKENFAIYGIGNALCAFGRLLKMGACSDVKLFLCVPYKIDNTYLQDLLAESDMPADKIFVYNKPIDNMGNLLSSIDIYLRPTITDGDSLLVREALANQCVVLASNAANRPQNTILYETNSQDDLTIKLGGVIADLQFYKQKLSNESDFFQEVFEYYEYIEKI